MAPLGGRGLTGGAVTFSKANSSISEISTNLSQYLNQQIEIKGWLDTNVRRARKGLSFVSFRDAQGDVNQVLIKDEELIRQVKGWKKETCVAVRGTVQGYAAAEGVQEPGTRQWELVCDSMQLLNTPNEECAFLKEYKDDTFPAHLRYLQLRSAKMQHALKVRSQTAQLVRNELLKQNFTEVETPILFKSTPEGAREFLVPTRSGKFYALPQSPQQYKQLLMSGGVHKYFQIARCFRDEDLRADRQPEFTQVDVEMSFADAQAVQEVMQRLIEAVFGSRLKIVPRVKYLDILRDYGSDKPDLRSYIKNVEIGGYAQGVLEAFVVKKGAPLAGSEQNALLVNPNSYNNRVPKLFRLRTAEDVALLRDSVAQEFARLHGLKLNAELGLDAQVGDLVAVSTRESIYENPTPLGRLRQLIISECPAKYWRDPELTHEFVGMWVDSFPLFQPVEVKHPKHPKGAKPEYPTYDFQHFASTHHPFTMVKLEHYGKLATAPLECQGDHYDFVINGCEVGGGSRRIHDAALQKYVFKEILGIKQYDRLFGHLIDGLACGCPPHAGMALGFDRIVAMLVGSQSIRDVIAFPKNTQGADMVVGSPTVVKDHVLKEYRIMNRY